jgi:hypothetical protein
MRGAERRFARIPNILSCSQYSRKIACLRNNAAARNGGGGKNSGAHDAARQPWLRGQEADSGLRNVFLGRTKNRAGKICELAIQLNALPKGKLS